MGSLFKSPKAPTVVSTPTPVTAPVIAPVVSNEPEVTDEEVQTEAREQSLLRRNRGRLGTINTGFTGFLSAVDDGSARKTLLGE